MKRAPKYILYAIAGLLVLILLLPATLYVPAIQNALVRYSEQWINGHTGMSVSIGRLSLRFPLDLALDDVMVAHGDGDTLAAVGSARVNVALLPLLRKKAYIPDVSLTDVRFDFAAEDSSLFLGVKAGALQLASGAVDLAAGKVRIGNLSLADADVSLVLRTVADTDSVAASPLPDWDIDITSIALSDITYTMYMPPVIDTLRVTLPQAGITGGRVSLAGQQVDVEQFYIDRGRYRYVACHTAEADTASADTTQAAAASMPWQISVAKVMLTDNEAAYMTEPAPAGSGFDARYIAADHICVALSSVYNRGSELRLTVDSLSLNERSGVAVTRAAGGFEMQESRIVVNDFSLYTPYSDLHADVDADMRFFENNSEAAIYARLESNVALTDVEKFYPAVKQFYIHPRRYVSPYTPAAAPLLRGMELLSARVEAEGTCEKLQLKTLRLSQPGIFTLQAEGEVTSVWDEVRRRARMSCRASTTRAVSLQNFITDSLLLGRVVMQPLRLGGRVDLQGSRVDGGLFLGCLQGGIAVRGGYDFRREKYEAKIGIRRFPIDSILPYDSVGALTARAEVSGAHFNPTGISTSAELQLTLDTLSLRGVPYNGARLSASLGEQRWQIQAGCEQRALDVGVDAQGLLTPDLFVVDVQTDVRLIDLAALRFATDTFNISGGVKAQLVASRNDSLLQADVEVDKLVLAMGNYRYRAGSISCVAASDITYSYIDLSTGDIEATLTSDVGLGRLSPSLERLTQFVDTVWQRQRLNMDELHRGLPPFAIDIQAGRNNILQQYLNSMGVKFTGMQLNARNDSLFALSAYLQRLNVAGTQLDTINFVAREAGKRLNYSLEVKNKPGNLDEFALLTVEGFLSGNSTRLLCRQENRDKENGFLLGCKVDFLDSLLTVSFGPKQPVIGYKTWELNPGNYFTYNHQTRDIEADIRLAYGDSRIYLSTESRRNKSVEGVHLDVRNIRLSDWLVASPFMPPVDGNISTDIYVDLPPAGIEAEGTLGIRDFRYANQRVGSFDIYASYELNAAGSGNIGGTVQIDSVQVLQLSARYDTRGKGIGGEVQIDALPLSVANAFFPAKMGDLAGTLDSNLSLSGTMDQPWVDGFIRFKDAKAVLSSLGASLTLDSKDIPIRQNRIYFDAYGLRGVNGNPLNIDGTVDFSDLSRIGVTLDLAGRNFEPVRAPESRTAMLYGSVFADVAARIRGSLDNMSVNGRISLLSGTNATYVMQSSQMQTGQDYSNMVTFVSFADTVETYEKIANSRVSATTNINATVNIDIDEGVRLGVNLSTDGNNRIDLVGGGTLLYTMTALGDSRFTGRYNLTGGFVRYNPPILSQKIFNIQEGSYVLWNGDIADPSFNIKAVQRQRSSVSEGDKGSRPVEFDITIYVTNTLKNLGISFDLSTTDDITIQNELQGLTPEQRSSKAINMLLYNSYTGFSSAADMAGNPLNSFLESELNMWAQKTLKGVELSFGINDYGDDGTGTQRTDYSYKISKSLFDNRLKVVVGGSYATNQDATQNLKENLIDDISLEYRLTKRENMYLKVFRHTGYESIIEGEITQTGVGFLYRKQLMSLLDLFRKRRNTVLPYSPLRGGATTGGAAIAVPDTTAVSSRKEELDL